MCRVTFKIYSARTFLALTSLLMYCACIDLVTANWFKYLVEVAQQGICSSFLDLLNLYLVSCLSPYGIFEIYVQTLYATGTKLSRNYWSTLYTCYSSSYVSVFYCSDCDNISSFVIWIEKFMVILFIFQFSVLPF